MSGTPLVDAESFPESPACQSAAAIVAASELAIDASAVEFAVTAVAVAGRASGFAAGADEDGTLFIADFPAGVFTAVDFSA